MNESKFPGHLINVITKQPCSLQLPACVQCCTFLVGCSQAVSCITQSSHPSETSPQGILSSHRRAATPPTQVFRVKAPRANSHRVHQNLTCQRKTNHWWLKSYFHRKQEELVPRYLKTRIFLKAPFVGNHDVFTKAVS